MLPKLCSRRVFQIAVRFAHESLNRLLQTNVAKILSNQAYNLLICLVQMNATVTDTVALPIVLSIYLAAVVAPIIVRREPIVLHIVAVCGIIAVATGLLSNVVGYAIDRSSACALMGNIVATTASRLFNSGPSPGTIRRAATGASGG